MAKKKNTINILPIAVIVVIAAVLTQILFSAFAATGTAYLSSNKSTVKQGESFTVSLRVNTDVPISIVRIRTTFNSSQLQFTGIDYTGSPLDKVLPESTSGTGFVQAASFKFPDAPPLPAGFFPSGNVFIANLNFKALQASGIATINIDQPASVVYDSENASNILTGVSGTSVTMQSADVNPPTSPPPTGPNPTSPTTSSGGTGATSSGSGSGPSGDTSSGGVSSSTDGPGTSSPESLGSSYAAGSTDLQEPGQSRYGTQPSIAGRALSWVQSFAPYFVALSGLGLLVFVAFNKIHHHSHSIATASVGGSGSPTVGTTKKQSKPTVNGGQTKTEAPNVIKPNTGSPGPGYGVLIGNDKINKDT